MNEKYFEANRKNWDDRVEPHSKSIFYNLKKFKETKNSLFRVEQNDLGDITGKKILHLQCHFGMDSLSLANKGAIVTGVDFSGEAIKLARSLSKELNIPATFIQSNIYSLQQKITEQFDIVFTSYGVLAWLPDLEGWAKLIYHCLKPGGFFYIIDGHPYGQIFDEENKQNLRIKYSYFTGGQVERYEDGYTYACSSEVVNSKENFQWTHTIDSIINSIIGAGLQLEYFHEFPFSEFQSHPILVKHEDGYFYFPADFPIQIPLMFSLKAYKKKNS
jgi:SAM-dependent methyltransferase